MAHFQSPQLALNTLYSPPTMTPLRVPAFLPSVSPVKPLGSWNILLIVSRAQTGQVGQVQATPLLFLSQRAGRHGHGGKMPFHAKALDGTVPVTASQWTSSPSGDR